MRKINLVAKIIIALCITFSSASFAGNEEMDEAIHLILMQARHDNIIKVGRVKQALPSLFTFQLPEGFETQGDEFIARMKEIIAEQKYITGSNRPIKPQIAVPDEEEVEVKIHVRRSNYGSSSHGGGGVH